MICEILRSCSGGDDRISISWKSPTAATRAPEIVQIGELRRRIDGGEAAGKHQQVGRHAARVIVSGARVWGQNREVNMRWLKRKQCDTSTRKKREKSGKMKRKNLEKNLHRERKPVSSECIFQKAANAAKQTRSCKIGARTHLACDSFVERCVVHVPDATSKLSI
jgi:hypothetical protein